MKLPWLAVYEQALEQALESGRLGHAPLLQGPPGVGKSQLARWLVARILCINTESARPCGTCHSCRLLAAGTHPDLFLGHIPEDKTQITVDVVRELTAGLQLTPSIGPHRVALIEPAERMNTNAANALLKTLEEPVGRAWLILVSDRPGLLPATVRSRCQKITVQPPSRAVAHSWLSASSPDSEDEDITLALDVCADAPLKALELLKGDGLKTGREVRRVLQELAAGKPAPADLVMRWAEGPEQTWNWVSYWLKVWLEQALDSDAADMPSGSRPADLTRAWQQALQGKQLVETPIRNDLLFEKWLLEWQSMFAAGR